MFQMNNTALIGLKNKQQLPTTASVKMIAIFYSRAYINTYRFVSTVYKIHRDQIFCCEHFKIYRKKCTNHFMYQYLA